MSAFNHKYNTDDVLFRATVVGLLNYLNQQVHFENVWEDDTRETVYVSFFYGMAGDERFLQDYFTKWSDCKPYYVEGSYDRLPRGHIVQTGMTILPTNLTSPFVRGFYTKEINGELQRFNSYLSSIPIQLNYDVTILTDTQIDAWKIVQATIESLYSTVTYRINFKGTVVPCQGGFPVSESIDKLLEFTYPDKDTIAVKFPIEILTHLPVFDKSQELSAASSNLTTQMTTMGETHTYTASSGSVGSSAENVIGWPTDTRFLKKEDPNDRYSGYYWE